MIKRWCYCLFALAIGLVITSCADNPPIVESPAQQEAGTLVEGDGFQVVLGKIEKIQEAGGQLIACFDGYEGKSDSEKRNVVKAAEQINDQLSVQYDELIDLCKGDRQLASIEYQAKLLKHIIPQKITDSSAALQNASVLYQLNFQQMSSSSHLMADDVESINLKKGATHTVRFYEEVPEMPTPDSIIYGVEQVKVTTNTGDVQYMYRSQGDSTDAQLNYNLYLIALGMDTGFSLRFDNTRAYVSKGTQTLSIIQAGTDQKNGEFFIVSFAR